MDKSEIKVLLVDDESLVRKLVSNCIDWSEYGMEIFAEAAGAQEALDIMEETLPDVVFADICMPKMDGIEFSRCVKVRFPYVRVVILTGHDEFEYARQSVKIGVSDFLLKPVNPDEIRNVAGKLQGEILGERQEMLEYNRLKRQLDEQKPLLRAQFFLEWGSGAYDTDSIEQKLSFFGIPKTAAAYQSAVLELSLPMVSSEEEGRLMARLDAERIASGFFSSKEGIFYYKGRNGGLVLFSTVAQEILSALCEEFVGLYTQRYKGEITIGVSSSRKEYLQFPQMLKEARQAVDLKIVEGKNLVLHYDQLNLKAVQIESQSQDMFNQLENYLLAGLIEEVEALINDLFEKEKRELIRHHRGMSALGAHVITVFISVTDECGIPRDAIYSLNPYKEIFAFETLPEQQDYLLSLAAGLVQEVRRLRSKNSNQLIDRIRSWIDEHYSDPSIMLTTVASEFNHNSSYLCRKFKQETGETFVEYLSRIRVQKSIDLLKHSDLLNYEIAAEIGISDPHYFGILFKKVMNMSISDFRRKLKMQDLPKEKIDSKK